MADEPKAGSSLRIVRVQRMMFRVAGSTTLRRFGAVGLGGAALFLTIGAGQRTILGGTATKPDAMRMLGVCSYDASKLACWNLAGRRDGELTQRLDKGLRKRNTQSFQYQYGMKNRLLVFEQEKRASVRLSTPGESYINSSEIPSDGLGPRLVIAAIAADEDRKTATVSAVLQTGESAGTAAAKLTEGTSIALGSVQVTVGVASIQQNDSYPRSAPNAPAIPRRRWNYPLTVTSPPGTVAELSLTAIDARGDLIENVDAEGRPIPRPAPTPESERFAYGYNQPISVYSNSGGGSGVFTTIDPETIREVRWSASLSRLYEFRDVPLDPRR